MEIAKLSHKLMNVIFIQYYLICIAYFSERVKRDGIKCLRNFLSILDIGSVGYMRMLLLRSV